MLGHRDVGLSVHALKEAEDEFFMRTSHDRQVEMNWYKTCALSVFV